MLLTDEKLLVYDDAQQLAKMIVESEPVEHYVHCYHKLKNNKQAQQKIAEFVEMKEAYEEVHRFGKYHPDYGRIMKQMHCVKREMDLMEDVANFKKAEKDLQDILDEISVLIGRAVSVHIKVPTGNPFFEQLSCTGGCSTDSGCGSA